MPVVVELWRFSPDRSILDLIFDSVAHSEVSIRRDELLQAINHGYVVLLLDGLDEVPDSSRRECLAQIVAIIDRYPRSRLVLTSRQFPKPPEHFRCFHIGALRDADIAAALLAHFGSTRQFRDRFHDLSPDDFVRLELRPEVRQLFRTPLTFGLVLTLLENESTLPKTLFQMYDRFLSWLLDWDVRRDYLPSVTAAIISAEAAAYAMVSTDRVHLAATDWVRAAGNALSISRNDGVVQYATADDVIRVFLSNGLLVNQGGHVSFAHRSFGEFLAARHILNSETPPHIDPISIKTEVARFLCSALPDVSLLLEEIYRNCTDVITMMPFLKEACLANSYDNRFQELYDAIVESQNMAITLTHFLRGPEENAFTDRIDDLVDICLDFRPKALSVLKEAADGIVRGLPWPSSRNWFERIVAGLEEYDWPGAMLHRRLVQIGAFESMDVFCSDGSDPDEDDRVEELFKYLEAVYNDDFVKASQHVEQIAQFLLEQNRYRVSEPKDTV